MIWPEFKFTTVSIAPYQPREGPETISCELSKNHNARIDTYQPREGPETRCRIPHQRFLALLGIDAYLPREGPETLRSEMRSPIRGNGIDTYLPREGTETYPRSILWNFHYCIDTYLPREGPETFTS